MPVDQTILTVLGVGTMGEAISLVYGTMCKALVQAGIARITTDPGVQNNLERLVIAAFGAVCGLVLYALTVVHPTAHDAIVAALSGAGTAGVGIVGYHAPALLKTALRGPVAPVPPATPPAAPGPV